MCKDTNLALSIAKNAHNCVRKEIRQQNLFSIRFIPYALFTQADQIFVPVLFTCTQICGNRTTTSMPEELGTHLVIAGGAHLLVVSN